MLFFESMIENQIETRTIEVSYGYFDQLDYVRSDLSAFEVMGIGDLEHVESLYTRFEILGNNNELTINNHQILMNDTIYMSYSQFNQYDEVMLVERNVSNPYITGESLSADGIIISELALLYAGVFDYEEVIGQHIILTINDYHFNLRVDAVFDAYLGDDYFDESLRQTLINENGLNQQTMLHPLIMGEAIYQEIIEQTGLIGQQRHIIVRADSVYNVADLHRDIQNLVPNEVTSKLEQIMILIERVNQLSDVILVGLVVVFIQSFLLIFGAIYTKINNQKDFLDLLMVVGYKKKDFLKFYFFDYFFVFIKSVLIASVFAIVLSYAIDLSFRSLYQEHTTLVSKVFTLSWSVYVQYLIIYFLIYSFIVYISIMFFIRRRGISHDPSII